MSIKNHQDLSREAVFSILDEMQAAGTQPTVALIRENFDSAPYSVISNYLADWMNQHETREQDKFPAGPENLSQGLARLWAQARLLSDEETEKERLDLADYRQSFVQEKQDMLLEIQRLERENQPQEDLRTRFNAERCKLEEQIEILHNEIKEIRLKQVDEKIDKQRSERDALSIELQKTQLLHEELKEKSDLVKKLTIENTSNQEQLLMQNSELDKVNVALSTAQAQIDELQIHSSSLDEANNALSTSESKIEELLIQNAELNNTRDELSTAQNKTEELLIKNAELNNIRDDLSVAQSKIEELRIQNDELNNTRDELSVAQNKIEELLIQNDKLNKTSDDLSIAQNKIEELLRQKATLNKASIDLENAQNKIEEQQASLLESESKLNDFNAYKDEQHSIQEKLETSLEQEKQKKKELEDKHSKTHQENDALKESLLQEKIAAGDSIDLEKKVKELTEKTFQYKNVLKDKQTRYEKLEKENIALRSANELKSKLKTQEKDTEEESVEDTNVSLIQNIEDEVASLGRTVPELDLDADLDLNVGKDTNLESEDANASKLKDGEKILELAKEFAID